MKDRINELIKQAEHNLKDSEERDVITQVHFYTGMISAYRYVLLLLEEQE